MNNWLCMRINTSYHHGDKDAVTLTIKRIFGSDLKELLFVCDEEMWKSGEYYCFVLCDKYDEHISALKEHSMFFQVVPDCNKPDWLTREDVDRFVGSVQDATRRDAYIRGDIISIKEGYLKNLCGLVIDKHRKRYKVAFHFYTKRFVEYLPETHLQFMGNVFKHRRFPVTRKSIDEGHLSLGANPELQEALKKVASNHKIHRKKNRGRGKAG